MKIRQSWLVLTAIFFICGTIEGQQQDIVQFKKYITQIEEMLENPDSLNPDLVEEKLSILENTTERPSPRADRVDEARARFNKYLEDQRARYQAAQANRMPAAPAAPRAPGDRQPSVPRAPSVPPAGTEETETQMPPTQIVTRPQITPSAPPAPAPAPSPKPLPPLPPTPIKPAAKPPLPTIPAQPKPIVKPEPPLPAIPAKATAKPQGPLPQTPPSASKPTVMPPLPATPSRGPGGFEDINVIPPISPEVPLQDFALRPAREKPIPAPSAAAPKPSAPPAPSSSSASSSFSNAPAPMPTTSIGSAGREQAEADKKTEQIVNAIIKKLQDASFEMFSVNNLTNDKDQEHFKTASDLTFNAYSLANNQAVKDYIKKNKNIPGKLKDTIKEIDEVHEKFQKLATSLEKTIRNTPFKDYTLLNAYNRLIEAANNQITALSSVGLTTTDKPIVDRYKELKKDIAEKSQAEAEKNIAAAYKEVQDKIKVLEKYKNKKSLSEAERKAFAQEGNAVGKAHLIYLKLVGPDGKPDKSIAQEIQSYNDLYDKLTAPAASEQKPAMPGVQVDSPLRAKLKEIISKAVGLLEKEPNKTTFNNATKLSKSLEEILGEIKQDSRQKVLFELKKNTIASVDETPNNLKIQTPLLLNTIKKLAGQVLDELPGAPAPAISAGSAGQAGSDAKKGKSEKEKLAGNFKDEWLTNFSRMRWIPADKQRISAQTKTAIDHLNYFAGLIALGETLASGKEKEELYKEWPNLSKEVDTINALYDKKPDESGLENIYERIRQFIINVEPFANNLYGWLTK